MKKFEEYTQTQQLYLIFGGLEDAISEVYNDKIDLDNYKKNQIESFSEKRIQEMEVLILLEKLGYSMEEIGTYLYKNMIIKIADSLNNKLTKKEFDDLLDQITNHYSQFYLDLARNDLDMGIKTFHSIIEKAILKIDYEKADKELFYNIFGDNVSLEYDEKAFVLGAYVSLNLKQEKQKIKVK